MNRIDKNNSKEKIVFSNDKNNNDFCSSKGGKLTSTEQNDEWLLKEEDEEVKAKLIDEYLDLLHEPNNNGSPKSCGSSLEQENEDCEKEMNFQEEQERGKFSWNGVQEIQSLTEKNTHLMKKLVEKDKELEEITVLLEACAPIPGINPESFLDVFQGTEIVDQDIRDAKIVHLAKKIRHINVCLQKEKTKTTQALQKVAKLQSLLAERDDSAAYQKKEESFVSAPSLSHIKKLDELRAKLEKTSIELKKTQRALVKEVGEGISLNKILSEESGWKGRSQTIVMLKAKLQRLEQKPQDRLPDSKPRLNVVAKAQEDLQDLRNQRQEQLDSLIQEKERVLNELETCKKRYEAAKSRVRVLEKENGKAKSQIKVLLDKANTDDTFIDALHKEVSQLRNKDTFNGKNELERPYFKKNEKCPQDEDYQETTKITENKQYNDLLKQYHSQQEENESLKKSFQNAILAKDEELAALQDSLTQFQCNGSLEIREEHNNKQVFTLSDNMQEKIVQLQDENQFLRGELEKLKVRYSTLVEKFKTSEVHLLRDSKSQV